jgi:hypothetical protein
MHPDDDTHQDTHGETHHEFAAEAEGPAPCAAALVAGTLALMTTWADSGAGPTADDRRRVLARKVVSNLFFLSQHPGLMPALRQVAAKTHERWVPLAQGAVRDGRDGGGGGVVACTAELPTHAVQWH